jgi:hypothetical protein
VLDAIPLAERCISQSLQNDLKAELSGPLRLEIIDPSRPLDVAPLLVPRAMHELLTLVDTLLVQGGNRVTVANQILVPLGGVLLSLTVANLTMVHMHPRTAREVVFTNEHANAQPKASP